MKLKPRHAPIDAGYPRYDEGRKTNRRELLRLLAAGGAALAAGSWLSCGDDEPPCPVVDPDDPSLRPGGLPPRVGPPPGSGDSGPARGADATTSTGQTTTSGTGVTPTPEAGTQTGVQASGQASTTGSGAQPEPQPEATQQSNKAIKQVR